MKCLPWRVVIVFILALPGCWLPSHPIGIPLRSKAQFESEWNNYLTLPETKCLAGAGDRGGVYVSGFAVGSGPDDLEAVIATALLRCEQRRRDRKLKGRCHAWAIGNVATEELHLENAPGNPD
jgi:hypothetical protein